MKKQIKVLHLASFSGNIGDFANHQGFYKKFRTKIPSKFTQLEIRKFYKSRSEMRFNNSFIRLVNKHDLLVIGGGGFFDLRWDYSHTGTTIDFSERIIKAIKIPVLVNAMGYHEFNQVKENNIIKFKNFLNNITKNENWFVSIRNDGSLMRMRKRYGNLVSKILVVPDNGFWFKPRKYNKYFLKDNNTIWIGLNITNELFDKKFNRDINVEFLNDNMGKFINKVLKENNNYKFILFPHTYKDIITMGKVINKIDDNFIRERIVVAPLFVKEESMEQVFDLYRICSCVIGMRFHTNVCCIGMNIPTLGLAGHEQILSLYNEVGLSDRCITINNKYFVDELHDKLIASLNNIEQIKSEYSRINLKLKNKSNLYFKMIESFIGKKHNE